MSKPVAIITGAGKGIGRATAQVLNERGFRLALIARTQRDLDETAASCKDAITFAIDVTDYPALQSAVKTAHEHFGQLDAAIHVAGLAPIAGVEQMTIEEWDRVIAVNLTAAFALAKFVWPIFKAQKRGSIVNVSSVAAKDPFAGFLAYGAAKAGINTFDLALAREGAASGIRVYTVAPGATETGMFRSILSPEQFPREKTMDPIEVARVISQCVDGELQHTSGEVIYVRKGV